MSKKQNINDLFDIGYEIGVNAIDTLGKETNNKPSSHELAGLISSILNFAYVFAPNENVADSLLEFATDFAKQEAKDYKEGVQHGH